MNKIKIGLFGFGVVGQGIFQVLSKSRNAHAEIVKICVRSNKPRSIDASYFTTDPEVILSNPEIDLIVEVIDRTTSATSAEAWQRRCNESRPNVWSSAFRPISSSPCPKCRRCTGCCRAAPTIRSTPRSDTTGFWSSTNN